MSAVAFGLAGLAAAGVGLVAHGSSTAAPLRAEIVAASCSPGKTTGQAKRVQPTLRVNGASRSEAELRPGDLLQTDSDGSGDLCLRVATLDCRIPADTIVRVLPPRKPKVLLRLVKAEDPFTCTAIAAGKDWELETGERTRILMGEAVEESVRARNVTDTSGERDVAQAPRSAYALSLVVSKRQTLVKVRRGATIVAQGANTRRAVVLGRQQQVVVPSGRDPRQPTGISLSRSEKRTFKQLEKSLPPATDKTPPAVTIQGPRNPSSVRSATFSLGTTEVGTTFSCALDGSDFRLCGTPYRVDGLRPGRHTLSVRALDATGTSERARTHGRSTRAGSPSRPTARGTSTSGRSTRMGRASSGSPRPAAPTTRRTGRPTGGGSPSTATRRQRRDLRHERRRQQARRGSPTTRRRTNPPGRPTARRSPSTSERDGNREIYVMNADGTAQTRLTNNPAVDVAPAWSPDGSKIAFASDRDGNSRSTS